MNPQTQTSGDQVAKQDKPQAISGKAKPADQPKEKFPWLVALLVAGAATAAVMLIIAASKTSTTPIELKTYTLGFTYQREDVKYPNYLFSSPSVDMGFDGGRVNDGFVCDGESRVNDYTFSGTFPRQHGAGTYGIIAWDHCRGDKEDGTIRVGYRFKVRVKETGSEATLTAVLTNTIGGILYITEKSTMGRFRLTEDGEVFEY